jgi:hypothetical protein
MVLSTNKLIARPAVAALSLAGFVLGGCIHFDQRDD